MGGRGEAMRLRSRGVIILRELILCSLFFVLTNPLWYGIEVSGRLIKHKIPKVSLKFPEVS